MKAPITFAICGFGDRGSTYASMEKLFPEKMKVVAVADLNPDKVNKAKELYQIPEENCYLSGEEMLAQEKLADVMVVSTMDRQHVDHAIPALKKGYHILLENPSLRSLASAKKFWKWRNSVLVKSSSAMCCATRLFIISSKNWFPVAASAMWSRSAPTKMWVTGIRPIPLCVATGAIQKRQVR